MSTMADFRASLPRAALRSRSRFWPRTPQTIDGLGISQNILVDLMLKLTMLEGRTTLNRLANQMKVAVPICNQIFTHLRQEQSVEVKGMVGNDYEFALTAAGRKIAQDRFALNQYVGPAPVSLQDYTVGVRKQAVRQKVNRGLLQEVFQDLVLEERVIDQLGPAIISNSQIFLYGSTGNGKTSIAERLVRVYRDTVYVPYAIEVQGQIINIYDTVVHRPLDRPEDVDPRWIHCERPCIAVGGELMPEMLDLRREEALGYYTGPMQMKANNGMFIIDDFGRQMMNPRDLLNRWIVPLDRRVDYLSLRTGVTFPVPFETLVVFSTNLDPRQLADEAFLRRIQNKVKVDAISPEIFDRILARVCEKEGVAWNEEASAYARERCKASSQSPVLRACYPRDIVSILNNIAEYEGRPAKLDQEDIDRAVALYFAR